MGFWTFDCTTMGFWTPHFYPFVGNSMIFFFTFFGNGIHTISNGKKLLSFQLGNNCAFRFMKTGWKCQAPIPRTDTFTSQKVLVIPRKRWLHPDMTEKLFTGTLSKNETKYQEPGAQLEGNLGEILALGAEISPYIGVREKWESP